MHSSWLPWDFFENHKELFTGGKRIIALCSYDPFFEKMALSLPVSKRFESDWENRDVHSLATLKDSWFEDNILTQDLFSDSQAFLLIQAEQTSKRLKQNIIENLDKLDEQLLIFVFSKNDDFFKELSKHQAVETLQIKEPPFWNFDKLFDFLCRKLQVYLDYKARSYLVDVIKQETHEVVNVLKNLKINFPNQDKITLDNVQEIISPQRLDNFKLADLYGTKKFIPFYKEIFKHDFNFDEYRSMFNFLQSHLVKMMDTSYIDKKPRPTMYDKKILAQSGYWKRFELADHLKELSQLEILAKSKSMRLNHKLRENYYANMV